MALVPPRLLQGGLQGGGFGPFGGWNGQITGFGNFNGYGPNGGSGPRGRYGRAMGMYQRLAPGGAFVPNALLPPPIPYNWGRKGGQAAYFDTGNVMWRYPQGMIRRQWPSLAQAYRSSGNRSLNPIIASGFGNNAAGMSALASALPQLQGSSDAWNVLMSLIGRNGSWSWGFNGQPDYYEQLFDLLRAAHDELVTGVSSNALDYRSNILLALSTVESISWVVALSGSFGFGAGMYWDLLTLLYCFAAILGAVNGPVHQYTYLLFECIARIFGNGEGEIIQCLNALDIAAQQELRTVCGNEVLITNDHFGLPAFIYKELGGT